MGDIVVRYQSKIKPCSKHSLTTKLGSGLSLSQIEVNSVLASTKARSDGDRRDQIWHRWSERMNTGGLRPSILTTGKGPKKAKEKTSQAPNSTL